MNAKEIIEKMQKKVQNMNKNWVFEPEKLIYK